MNITPATVFPLVPRGMDGGGPSSLFSPSLDLDTEEERRPPVPFCLTHNWRDPVAETNRRQRPKLVFLATPPPLLTPHDFRIFYAKLRELASPSVRRAPLDTKEFCRRVNAVVRNFLLLTPLNELLETLEFIEPGFAQRSFIDIQKLVANKVTVLLKQACVGDLSSFLALCSSVGVVATTST